MKNKLKFKKASLNATDLMKGEDGMFMLLKKSFVCIYQVICDVIAGAWG